MTSNATNMAVAITARGLKDYEKEVVEWSNERVGVFVEQECGLPQYKKVFVQHHVTGKIVGLITKQDLIDMGITKIGHQIRLLQKFKPFQAAQSAHKRLEGVQSWTEFVWPWHCWRFCYPRKFKLTQSGLRIRQDYWCGMGSEHTIDLCLIKDVKLHTTCCSCYVELISADTAAHPDLTFHIWSHQKGKNIYKTIYNASESNQERMAGSAFAK